MKKILILSLAFFILSCKNEVKTITSTEPKVDKSVTSIWKSYTDSNSRFKNSNLPDSWFFHNNKTDANRLGNLVVTGKKQAGSSLYEMYKHYGADLPKVGTKQIITDFDGKALAIIETKKVDTIPFNKISETYAALDMGTTDEPLNKWRKAHWDFFESAMKDLDKEANKNMLVVCEWFATVWPKN